MVRLLIADDSNGGMTVAWPVVIGEVNPLPRSEEQRAVTHRQRDVVAGQHRFDVRVGISLGVDYGATTSCYDPSAGGEACGRCDACQLRLKGFTEAGLEDPISYASTRGRTTATRARLAGRSAR